ncbi:MAG: acyltransferase family protein [Deltaproteobacteria bacterium]|nr:acyltransferase family protein [Deltaproteobacteria bacterium]
MRYVRARVTLLVDSEIERRVARIELPWSQVGVDPYGVEKTAVARMMTALKLLYRHYFRVKVSGVEHVPARGRAMLIGNHSGGVAIDAGMVMASCFFELEPPRLAQGMAEKFIENVPFASTWAARCGQFTGLPEHAVRLLNDGRLLMVFPEGARGTAKLFTQRDSLVDFGTGFMRLALQTGTPIIPFGVVGAGEALPTVYNSYSLGKAFGVPYVPFTPWLLPVPVPVQMGVHFGEPMVFEGTGREDDEVVRGHVDRVKERIAALIAWGHTQQ